MAQLSDIIENSQKKVLKAKTLVAKGNVIRIYGSAPGKERYSVTGENDTYDTVYDCRKNLWTCSCPNIKSVSCSHIIACMIISGRFFQEQTRKSENDTGQ